MSKLQIFEFLTSPELALEDNSAAFLPGQEKIWDLLKKNFGSPQHKRHHLFILDWRTLASPPPAAHVQKVFEHCPFMKLIPFESFSGTALTLYDLNSSLEVCESLFLDFLRLAKVPLPFQIRYIHAYEFLNSEGQPETRPEVHDALKQLLDLNEKSTLYDAKNFSASLLVPGAAPTYVPRATVPFASTDLPAKIIAGIQSAEEFWTDAPLKLSLLYPRQEREILEFPSIASSLFSLNKKTAAAATKKFTIARFPNKELALKGPHFSWFSSSAYCPFADASDLPAFLDEPVVDALFSHRPDNILHSPVSTAQKLYVLGAVHRSNHLLQKEVLRFWARVLKENPDSVEEWIVPDDSLVRKVFRVMNQASGWRLSSENATRLVQMHERRGPLDYALMFFCKSDPSALLPESLKHEVELLCLGKSEVDTLKCVIESDSATQDQFIPYTTLHESFGPRPAAPLEIDWQFPENKSPTYGFERAGIYPDQFVLKTNFRSSLEIFLSRIFLHRPPSERALRSPFRSAVERPKSFEKYIADSGEKRLCVTASTGEELAVDPLQGGINLVDLGVRYLLCGTGHVPRAAVGRLSVTPPRQSLRENTQGWAALLLGVEGVLKALDSYSISLVDIDISPHPSTTSYPELRLFLDEPASELVLPFDGFRMHDEVLFALGPRPAFADAGSTVLKHVRVISNHVTKIDVVDQRKVYETISGFMKQGKILTARTIERGGITEALAELGIKGNIGTQVRPTVPTIEMFSGSPGRILVGVAPQDAKTFEKSFPSEFLTTVGSTQGSKLMGAPLAQIIQYRQGVMGDE